MIVLVPAGGVSAEQLLELPPDEAHHLRVRRRGDLLTLESGPPENPRRHTRLRRVSVHLWRLEMPAASNRWNLTPFRDQLEVLLDLLVYQFPWTLAP
jgi:hypothetical protein